MPVDERLEEFEKKFKEKWAPLFRQIGETVAAGWTILIDAIDRRTAVERERLVFAREREARQAAEGQDLRLLYEARTMEFQAIALRLGDMVEKQYHTVK